MRCSAFIATSFAVFAEAFFVTNQNTSALSYDENFAKRELYLTEAAYCVPEEGVFWDCSTCVEGIELEAVILGRKSGGRALVGHDALQGRLFVSYRGTSNPRNWAENVDALFTAPYGPGDLAAVKVEAGLYDWYLDLKPSVDAALLAASAKHNNVTRVAVMGHSAGGAVATFHAFDLARTPKAARQQQEQQQQEGQKEEGRAKARANLLLRRRLPAGKEAGELEDGGGGVAAVAAAPASDASALKFAGMFVGNSSSGGSGSAADGHLSLASVVTFGSPRVGNAAFRDAHYAAMAHPEGDGGQGGGGGGGPGAGAGAAVPCWRVTHYRDMVPHLPQEALGYRHVATEVYYNEANTAYRVCDDAEAEDPQCSDRCAPTHCNSVDDHLDYLGVPLGSGGC